MLPVALSGVRQCYRTLLLNTLYESPHVYKTNHHSCCCYFEKNQTFLFTFRHIYVLIILLVAGEVRKK